MISFINQQHTLLVFPCIQVYQFLLKKAKYLKKFFSKQKKTVLQRSFLCVKSIIELI